MEHDDARAAALRAPRLRLGTVERHDRNSPRVPLDRAEEPLGRFRIALTLRVGESDDLGHAHARHEQALALERDQEAVELALPVRRVRLCRGCVAHYLELLAEQSLDRRDELALLVWLA